MARIVEENARLTRSQIVLGTASYLAPELADGTQSDLTTAVDVYGLGAVLYEMLTGRPPFVGASTAEILHQVIEHDPVPPPVANPMVDHDLSTIGLKCLEKSPGRRYGSAEALATDLTLWVQGKPISARPISTAGRITKWARRRPAIAALTSALAASLVIGPTLAIWQAVRATHAEKVAKTESANATRAEKSARDEAAISQAVNDFINNDLFGAASPDHEPDRDLRVRTVLDRAAAGIGNRFQDQPLVEAAIRLTLAETYNALGEYETAKGHAEQSLLLRQRVLGPERPDTLKSRMTLAITLNAESNRALAEKELGSVLQIQERVLGAEHPDTLTTRMNLANVLKAQGRPGEAEKELRAVVQIEERILGTEHPDTLRCRMSLADTLNAEKKQTDAKNELEAVLRIQERILGPEHPDSLTTKVNLANVLASQGKFAEADTEYRAVLQTRERVLGPEHPDTLSSRVKLAETLNSEGKLADGAAELWAVFQIQERVLGPKHRDTLSTRTNLFNTLTPRRTLALKLCDQGKIAEAETEFRAMLQIQEGVLGPEHPDTLSSIHSLAVCLEKQDKLDEARNVALRAMEGRRKVLGTMHPMTTSSENLFEELIRRNVTLPQRPVASLAMVPNLENADEWSRFRGPNGSGVAKASHLPSTLDANHTVWRVDIGRGASSPVGWKGRLFLTTEATRDKRAIICLDSRNGQELWRFESAYTGPRMANFADGFVSSTPFVDEDRVYLMDSVEALALDHDGKLLWRNIAGSYYRIPDVVAHASAVVSDGVMAARVEFGSDGEWRGASQQWMSGFVGLDVATGAQKWKVELPGAVNLYNTPVVHETHGKHEFILEDFENVMGVDAASGAINWKHLPGSSDCMRSDVLKNGILLFSAGGGIRLLRLGGNDPSEMTSIRGNGVATPLLVEDRLYLLANDGLLRCVKFPSGEALYTTKLSAGDGPGNGYPHANYLSSPVAADGKIYFASMSGGVIVVKPGDEFEVIATNELDGPITATPAIALNHLFVRTDKSLWCFGEKDGPGATESTQQAGTVTGHTVPSQ